MRRRWLLWMLAVLPVSLAGQGTAQSSLEDLVRILRLTEVVAVMRDEGLAHGEELDRDMLDGRGGSHWESKVSGIYDAGAMLTTIRDALAAELGPDEIAGAAAFFDTERGQKILSLETAARVAMADPDIEEIAKDTFFELDISDDPRLTATKRFVEANDLLERNVAGTLNSNYQFLRGLVDGGLVKRPESDILADVWAQQDDVRDDTESWLFGFLLMAYRPLDLADLDAYIAFSLTPSGRALNAALFEGFDTMFTRISYNLGVAVAREMMSSDL